MRCISPLLCTFALVVLASTGSARGLSTGLDPNASGPFPPAIPQPGQTCHVLWWNPFYQAELDRLTNLGISITGTANPADLTAANLANYDVLVVAYTGPGAIGFAQPVIDAFVASGRGLLIHQPNAVGSVDYAPLGFGVTIDDICWCGGCGVQYPAIIINGAHPLTAGMTNADLSGAFDLVGGIGAGYTLLAVSADCGDPAVAAGNYGTGRVVFETGNAHPGSLDPGSDVWWLNLFGWLCTGEPTPAHHTTWGSLKAIYR